MTGVQALEHKYPDTCSNPNDFGYEVSQWSLPLLVAEIKKQGIAEQISEKSVSRFLKMR